MKGFQIVLYVLPFLLLHTHRCVGVKCLCSVDVIAPSCFMLNFTYIVQIFSALGFQDVKRFIIGFYKKVEVVFPNVAFFGLDLAKCTFPSAVTVPVTNNSSMEFLNVVLRIFLLSESFKDFT